MLSKAFVTVLVISFAGLAPAAELPERVDFNFHIRPILSDRCFKCHGPDEKSRKADLRLDNARGAFAVLDKKGKRRAIVPKNVKASEVVRRITSTDPDEVMPPADSNLHLSELEIALLQKWIKQGAEYQSHWSFNPVKKIKAPKISQRGWARNPIDQIVLSRLQRDGLKPSPEATKETLIRRLAFDLTGLPPSLEEIDSFLNDSSADAYEKVVDHFLASPAYGERMANDWLDLARYADSYGYQSDVDCDLSPWRDWVIRSFNQNLSYDKFIAWQIAGDLFPGATDEQILATAFNRLHRQTNEGGSVEEEFRNEYVSDRLHTFGTAFLGLTFECARCHDHKYDPITQRDYYRLSAFFNNIDESGLYSHFTQTTPTPTLFLYGDGQKEKHAALKQQIAEQEMKLSGIETTAKKDFEQWLKTFSQKQMELTPKPAGTFSFEQVAGNQTPNSATTNSASLEESPQQVDGHTGKALKFDGESSVTIKDAGQFHRTDPFSFSLWIKPVEKQKRAVVFHCSRAWTDSGSRGYELVLDDGTPTVALIHFWPGNAIAIRTRSAIPTNEWTHLTITYDGSSRANGIRIFQNGALAEAEVICDNLFKDIKHRGEWGDADVGNVHLTLAARFRDSGFKNGLIDEFQVFDRCLTPLEIQTNCSSRRQEAHSSPPASNHAQSKIDQSLVTSAATKSKDLFTFFLNRHCTEYQTAVTELKKLREAENNFVTGVREIMVMRERPVRRPTFVLKRGAYDAPGDPVEPATPESIFPFAKNLPKNRLGLAKWMTDPQNPLPARVVVNRIWKMHFGRGLVTTVEDFGSQGQLPTHPELLDWMAKAFIDSGWDVKALHKLIVSSATYRQTSVAPPDLAAADPDNRLLARGPKHRFSAEQIRDSALAVSGLLSRKIGGGAVKPYQPAGLWENSGLAKSYAQDHGENLYRRSLYTFWRRTAPPPSMLTFDATSREVCTAKRETTATPLQSLVLLNDPQFIEAARVLAEKMQNEESGWIETVFRLVIGRAPQMREREILKKLYDDQMQLFASNADAAEKYLATGEYPRDPKAEKTKVAAAAVLINTLMNHDEFVTKR